MLELTLEQAKLATDPVRNDILMLLAERPASTQELAAAMGRPKGTVAYHLNLLEEASLIEVVRTRKVRAVTEKFYGRVATTYGFPHLGSDEGPPDFLIEALNEVRPTRDDEQTFFTLRHARIDADRLAEYSERLWELSEEFVATERGGTTVYGLLLGLYPTDRPSLPEDRDDSEQPT